MFIWESHIEMPSYLQDRLIKSFDHHSRFWNTRNELFVSEIGQAMELFVSESDDKYIAPITTYNNLHHFSKVEGLMDFYADIIQKMMKEIGMYKRCKYGFELWAQYYNNKTYGHEPHDHFIGNEIISFNHIIKPSKNKCFYFMNDEQEKNYYGKQDSGHFYAWPPWRVHGVERVEEENTNRLIVAGNVSLYEYVMLNGKKLVNK